jgi:type I restriction enzyme, S subunit
MNNSWQRAPLGEAITHRKEFVRISDFESYKRCRVQLHAKGILLRDIVSGAEIKTKEQQVCRAGEFLVAEIDAKVGGFGVVPDELDGSIVSSHYFLFEVNQKKLDGQFLDYFVRTPFFKDQVAARGSTNYAAIRPHHVLQYQIPLPPLPQQRRIVARIETLAEQIQEARTLRYQAVEEAESLVRAARNDVVTKLRQLNDDVQLGDVCLKITDGPHVSPRYVEDGVPFISVRNISETGLDFSSAKYVTQADHEQFSRKAAVERGDVLYTKGGTTGVARRVDTDRPFSIWVHVALLKLDRIKVDAGFVEQMLNSPLCRDQAAFFTRGSSNHDLGLSRMSNILFPLPPLSEQRRIVAELDALQSQVGALKKLQTETAAELDSLLPSILDRAFTGNL